jgi:hypothetical protein
MLRGKTLQGMSITAVFPLSLTAKILRTNSAKLSDR